ncbi:MAG: 50S ribosomal protein L9 [Deltaproteobacteria bacterium]|nr:50S ribosomal protein L9 [Deltaproteobacteria bacterium]
MKIILKDNVESLGNMGDTIKVSDGYARNYLIPKGLAIEASNRNIKSLDHEKRIIASKTEKERLMAESLMERLSKITCTISRKIGEQEKLFGSVTSKDIEDNLRDQGIEISRKNIVIEEPIKKLGEFMVKIKVYPGIFGQVKVAVVSEE